MLTDEWRYCSSMIIVGKDGSGKRCIGYYSDEICWIGSAVQWHS
jgi:hypothetical protein